MNSGVLAAFQTAAGIAPDKMNLFIRTVLLGIIFLWAAWCVYGEIHHFRHDGVEIDIALRKIMRILFIVAIMVVLVFISNGA